MHLLHPTECCVPRHSLISLSKAFSPAAAFCLRITWKFYCPKLRSSPSPSTMDGWILTAEEPPWHPRHWGKEALHQNSCSLVTRHVQSRWHKGVGPPLVGKGRRDTHGPVWVLVMTANLCLYLGGDTGSGPGLLGSLHLPQAMEQWFEVRAESQSAGFLEAALHQAAVLSAQPAPSSVSPGWESRTALVQEAGHLHPDSTEIGWRCSPNTGLGI